MPHPNGGQGNPLPMTHTFDKIYANIGKSGVEFRSTTGEQMSAKRGIARDGITPTIVLVGERNTHGRVCGACLGFSCSCTGERIGHAIVPLDEMA